MAKVLEFKPRANSVENFITSLAEHKDDIDSIAAVVKWKDHEAKPGTTQVYWTATTNGDAAWLDYVFRADFMQSVIDD